MYGPWQGDPPGYVHHGAWWGFLHLLPFLMFLVLIGVGIWAVLRFSSRPLATSGGAAALASTGGAGTIAPARDPAIEELRIRYARGELERDDFTQRMRDLGHPDIGPTPTDPTADGPPPTAEGDDAAGDG